MTEGDLGRAIEAVLGELDYESPISLDYVAAVRDTLLARLPPGASVDCYHRWKDLCVTARLGTVWCRVEVPLPD